jgi:serine/threonine protein kinase
MYFFLISNSFYLITRHENILKFYCWFEDEEKFYIVLEYAHKGDLFEWLNNGNPVNEKTAATVNKIWKRKAPKYRNSFVFEAWS